MGGFAMTDFTGAPLRDMGAVRTCTGNTHEYTPHVYIGVYSSPLVGEEAPVCLSQGRGSPVTGEPGHASDPTDDGALALAKQPLGPGRLPHILRLRCWSRSPSRPLQDCGGPTVPFLFRVVARGRK